jgi:GNAT superfamily N-acetyltransferase
MERTVEIAPAKPDDFPAIRELCNDFLNWCRERYGENAWFVDHYYTPEKTAALLESLPTIHSPPDGEVLVARVNEKIVGCVMMQRIDDKTCEMKRMFTSSDGRGLGIGRRLAENIVRIAAERGHGTMRLDTGRNHDAALSLINRLDFEKSRRITKLPLSCAITSSFLKLHYRDRHPTGGLLPCRRGKCETSRRFRLTNVLAEGL